MYSGDDDSQIYKDDGEWQEDIQKLVDHVWRPCARQPDSFRPDAVWEIFEDPEEIMRWSLRPEPAYKQVIQPLLLTMEDMLDPRGPRVYYESLIHLPSALEGIGDSSRVRLKYDPTRAYVYKSVDLLKYLENPEQFAARIDNFYHEIRTINSLPRHSNLITGDRQGKLYVTIGKMDGEYPTLYCGLICGTLTAFMVNGSLDDFVTRGSEKKLPLNLSEKAKWCYQMSSAMFFIYHTGKTYDADIRPGKMLLDNIRNLRIIDWVPNENPNWEQSITPPCCRAPETDGSKDVTEVNGKLVYSIIYTNDPLQNHPLRVPENSVFKDWMPKCPKAVEKAEVYSLGKTMWMLLQGVSELEETSRGREEIYWSRGDVPESWKRIVDRCLERDPKDRVSLQDLCIFWMTAKTEMILNGG